jgi:HemY protein
VVEAVVKVEKAEAEAPAVVATVVEPIPVKTVTPAKTAEKTPVKVETVEEKEEERPFYGLPDDPGVKEGIAKRDGTSGFRLF